MAVISDYLHHLHLTVTFRPHNMGSARTTYPPKMREPHYGCKNMAFGFVKWPFLENAERKLADEGERWDDSYPIWVPCCLMMPFGWLYRGRRWPDCKKSHRQKDWEYQKRMDSCQAREQTKYPMTRISPCSLRPRAEDDNISNFDLNQTIDVERSTLYRLPLELRQEIYSYVLGREENCLVFIPFKIRAIPNSSAGHLIRTSNVTSSQLNQNLVARMDELFWPQRTALLRTCRQICHEAIGLLYTGNTFVVKHPRVLFAFIKSIPPQRLDSIRKLHISLTPPCAYDFAPEEWERFWEIILHLKRLRKLHVEMDYDIPYRDHEAYEEADLSQQFLQPMLLLRGLTDFKLDLRVSLDGDEVRLSVATKKLMKRVEKDARLLREEPRQVFEKQSDVVSPLPL
ncbi:MAG: hypothetical protein Q9218_005512 [Villophora microphyllina]